MIFFAVLANLHFKPVSDNRIKLAGDYADELLILSTFSVAKTKVNLLEGKQKYYVSPTVFFSSLIDNFDQPVVGNHQQPLTLTTSHNHLDDETMSKL